MKITNFRDKPNTDNPHGIASTKIYDKEHGVIMHLHLKAGEGLKPHITPVDVAFYVLEGAPTILIDEEKQVVKVDDIIESPKNIIHSIYNESETDVRVLVMKLPKPGTQTIIKD